MNSGKRTITGDCVDRHADCLRYTLLLPSLDVALTFYTVTPCLSLAFYVFRVILSPNIILGNVTTEKQHKVINYLSGFINEARRGRLEAILRQRTRHITVVLEDVYQPQNASAVVRTCECLGIQELHVIENLYEYRLNPAVVQGSSKWIDLIRHNREELDNTRACIDKLRQRGYRIIAMDPTPGGRTVEQPDVKDKLALCFGSEEPGLSATLQTLADETVSIPIHGFTRSYNLSVSAGISLYTLVTTLRNSSIDWQLDKRDATDLYIKWLAQSTPAGEQLLETYLKQLESLP